jgi:pyruvate,water dikinase
MEQLRPIPLTDPALPQGLGGKVGGLRWLVEHGFPVPATWVLPAPDADADAIAAALAPVIDPAQRYAVRSSANVEDGGAISYAGQFLSRLDVTNLDAAVDAVLAVVGSAGAEGVAAYQQHTGDDRPIDMNVIVQELVPAVAAGVAFSKNPITGLSETVVEAVAGTGEALMSGTATPDRWVQRWGDFVEQPEHSAVPPAVVGEVLTGVADIAAAFGAPVDLEWVHDGARLWWVQVRPITGIDGVTIYSRRISKEVMPGIIKPLVWSVNVPMVNQAWVDLFREALGDVAVEPEDLAKSFGYRSYFNMTAIGEVFAAMGMPRESLELLLGLPAGSEQPGFKPTATTMKKLPRMLAMAIRKARYGSEVERALPELEAEYARYADRNRAAMTDAELLADVTALQRIGVRSAGVNIVTPLLANAYAALLRRRLGKHGFDLTDVDLTEGMAELEALDPNPHLDRLAERIQRLDKAERAAILRNGYDAVPDELRREVDAFLDRFGHFSDSGNDFSIPAWREMPDTVVRMAATRPGTGRGSGRMAWRQVEAAIPAWRRPMVRTLRSRARTFIYHRETTSSRSGPGWRIATCSVRRTTSCISPSTRCGQRSPAQTSPRPPLRWRPRARRRSRRCAASTCRR